MIVGGAGDSGELVIVGGAGDSERLYEGSRAYGHLVVSRCTPRVSYCSTGSVILLYRSVMGVMLYSIDMRALHCNPTWAHMWDL